MNSTPRKPRSRWVGSPMPAPKSKLSVSPLGRQMHYYGAVELAGAGEQVNVNDVVEVTESKLQEESSQRHPVLVQVLSMWEDTFTGVFKFRARLLIHASDLPADILPRLHTSGKASVGDRSLTGSKPPLNKYQHGADGVFLTKSVEDLEVSSIVRPITLCVSRSTTTEASQGRNAKTGPRLTHAFCDKTGDFHPLEAAHPILKRARFRQANAIALALRADQHNDAAKNGKRRVDSSGWLLPKRGAFLRRGRRDGPRAIGGGVETVVSSTNVTGTALGVLNADIKASDVGGAEKPPNSEECKCEEGQQDGDDDATDSDSPRNTTPTLSVTEGSTPRKSARQRKSQRSPASDTAQASDAEANDSSEALAEDFSEAQVEYYPKAKVEDASEARAEDCFKTRMRYFPTALVEGCSEAQMEVCSEVAGRPSPSISTATFQRRRRVSSDMDRGQIPRQSRRLAMPPMAEEPSCSHVRKTPPLPKSTSFVAAEVARPVRTRMLMGLRPKSTPVLPRDSWAEGVNKASTQLSTTAKRKRGGVTKTAQGANGSDYPPVRTPVGKDFQTDIPDLLSAEERKQPHTRTGAKMVWRSIQEWDLQSRGMLAGYLHAAKAVVEAKQARPGVAVHVRLGGKKGTTGVDKETNTGTAGSYAVWAVSSAREACGQVRVACSEMAQTDIPRSAIQRVQSQEQALSALVEAKCVLDNFGPAIQLLGNDHGSPESIELWTLKQVRTLENALAKDYDPSRKLHGWARPGMDMDREDFIDLATVSKQVPGKTPFQVLSFYYKYLAAAQPLTDIVYGPEAAEARKKETISPAHKADAVLPDNGRLEKGNTHTARHKTSTRRVLPTLSKGSPANTSSDATEKEPKPNPRVIQVCAPKPSVHVVVNTEPEDCTATVDSVLRYDMSTIRDPSPPANNKVSSAPEPTPVLRSPTVSTYAAYEATSGGDDRSAEADRVSDGEVYRMGGTGGGRGSTSTYIAQQRRGTVGNEEVLRLLRPVRPDSDVLKVGDSHDADKGGTTKKPWVSTTGGEKSSQVSDMEVTAESTNLVGLAALSWVARQMRRRTEPAAAPASRPSGVQPMPSRSPPRHRDRVDRCRVGGGDASRHTPSDEASAHSDAQTELRLERPPGPHLTWHDGHVRCFDSRPSGGQAERSGIRNNGPSGVGLGGRRNSHVGSESAPVEDMFGFMAPCWRLVERANAYMDKDQLEYMKGLILTHVRTPMPKDQLLARAKSCLQEQGTIFAAFVKMFDRIDQPSQVPRYPTSRAPLPRPESTSYSVRYSSDAGPIYTSTLELQPPPQLSPEFTFKTHSRGSYSRGPVNDCGKRGVPISSPPHAYPRVAALASGHVEGRRSIHPYNHNGTGGWQATSVENSGMSDVVEGTSQASASSSLPSAAPFGSQRKPSSIC